MARPLGIQYPRAVYQARGSHGQAIFGDDKDRERFLETLAEACQKTGWRVHAYVLMGNHYHLLIETPEGNLVAGMKWLQSAYTQRYNRRRKLFGHFFQGRYKAVIVDEHPLVPSPHIIDSVFRSKPHSRKSWANGPIHTSLGQRPRDCVSRGMSANGAANHTLP